MCDEVKFHCKTQECKEQNQDFLVQTIGGIKMRKVEVCIKARSPPASLVFTGQVTMETVFSVTPFKIDQNGNRSCSII